MINFLNYVVRYTNLFKLTLLYLHMARDKGEVVRPIRVFVLGFYNGLYDEVAVRRFIKSSFDKIAADNTDAKINVVYLDYNAGVPNIASSEANRRGWDREPVGTGEGPTYTFSLIPPMIKKADYLIRTRTKGATGSMEGYVNDFEKVNPGKLFQTDFSWEAQNLKDIDLSRKPYQLFKFLSRK